MNTVDVVRWLAVPGTLAVFYGARSAARRWSVPLLHPVLLATLALGAMLLALGVEAHTYREGARPLTELLDYTVVALALPLYRQRTTLMRAWPRLIAVALAAACFALTSTIVLARLAGASTEVANALAPKSVTTPIAVAITEDLAGATSITAMAVLVAGVLGAAAGPSVLGWARVRSPDAVGLALGAASHALGTARAVEMGEEQAAHASVALVLCAVATALLAPWVIALLA